MGKLLSTLAASKTEAKCSTGVTLVKMSTDYQSTSKHALFVGSTGIGCLPIGRKLFRQMRVQQIPVESTNKQALDYTINIALKEELSLNDTQNDNKYVKKLVRERMRPKTAEKLKRMLCSSFFLINKSPRN